MWLIVIDYLFYLQVNNKNEDHATEDTPVAKFDHKYRLIGVISHKGQSISDGWDYDFVILFHCLSLPV